MALAFLSGDLDTWLDTQLNGATVYVSLHTGNPGTDGSNEVSGGSYVRQLVAFNAASGGSADNTDAETWSGITASTVVTHAGRWTAESGGTFKGGVALTNPQTVQSAGTVTLAAGDLDFGFNMTDPEA